MIALILFLSGLIIWEPERRLTYDQYDHFHTQTWAQESVVHVFYDDYEGIMYLRSTDSGIHWGDPVVITKEHYGTANMDFSDSIVYLAYSKTVSGSTYVYFRKSFNYGQVWQPPESLGKGIAVGYRGNLITAVGDTIFIGVEIRDPPPPFGSYLYFSFDGGITWQGPRYIEHTVSNVVISTILYKQGVIHVILVGMPTGLPLTNYYIYSTDFGITWSDLFMIPDSNAIAVQCAKRLVGGPNNELFVVWDENTYSPNILFNDVMFRRSPDGGQTWESIQQLIFDHACDAGAAVDLVCEDSTLYLVWSHSGGWPRHLWFMASTDLGTNWLPREDIGCEFTTMMDCNLASHNDKVYVVWGQSSPRYINVFFKRGLRIPVSVDQKEKLSTFLTLWPNPTASLLHISSKTSNPLQIVLFDNLGRRVKETTVKDEVVIDLSGMPSGVYFLRLKGINTSIKVIKTP